MNCPRCETTPLTEREREGLLIDTCASCRGLWLDRGELEKLIARATREFDELEPRRDERQRLPERHDDRYRARKHDDDDDDREHRRYPKKRRWFDALGEIFD